jgi:hypothetical protein
MLNGHVAGKIIYNSSYLIVLNIYFVPEYNTMHIQRGSCFRLYMRRNIRDHPGPSICPSQGLYVLYGLKAPVPTMSISAVEPCITPMHGFIIR